MARKSNKTSHVLHLLAGEEPVPEKPEEQQKTASEEPEEPEKPSEPPQKTEPQENAPSPDAPSISIISTGNSEGDPLADLIKDQLEEDFPEEILNSNSKAPSENDGKDDETDSPQQQPDAADDLEPQPEATDHSETMPDSPDVAPDDRNPQPDSGDISERTENVENVPSESLEEPAQPLSQDEPDTVSDEPASNEPFADTDSAQPSDNHTEPFDGSADSATPDTPLEINNPPLSREKLDAVLYPPEGEEVQNYRFVNVMEYIIKDMVIDYMKKFDMCTCERCVVDTTALALTYCPAKYIVVDKHTVSPLLNYYANRYVGDVTVELTKACIQVKDRPRH